MSLKIKNSSFFRMLDDSHAQGLLEYALIIALVSLVAVVALNYLGAKNNNSLKASASALPG